MDNYKYLEIYLGYKILELFDRLYLPVDNVLQYSVLHGEGDGDNQHPHAAFDCSKSKTHLREYDKSMAGHYNRQIFLWFCVSAIWIMTKFGMMNRSEKPMSKTAT